MLSGNVIVSIFQGYPFAQYILFVNTDLQQHTNGSVFIKGMSLSFSITMLVVYYTLFITLLWIVFAKCAIA